MVSAGNLVTLVVFSTLMGLASFGSGLIPLSVPLTPQNIRSVSVLGMGVLVGTAMAVIIPEGVETLYNSDLHAGSQAERRNRSRAASGAGALTKTKRLETEAAKPKLGLAEPRPPPGNHLAGHSASGKRPHDTTPVDTGVLSTAINERESHYVGLFLLLGFMFMYVMDHITVFTSLFTPSVKYVATEAEITNYIPVPPHPYALSGVSGLSLPRLGDFVRGLTPRSLVAHLSSSATLFGLIIHSMADGVAMGASISSSSTRLKGVVFLAIAIHKIPAAFGLVSVLMASNAHIYVVKLHLVLFSLAAPLGSWLTFGLIHLLGGSRDVIEWWTGALLLFSGGTFLYVAVNALQSLADHEAVPRSAASEVTAVERGLTPGEMGLSILGMALPLLVAYIRE